MRSNNMKENGIWTADRKRGPRMEVNNGVRVRRASEADLPEAAMLLGDIYSDDDFIPEGEKNLRDLKKALQESRCNLVLIAEKGGKAVGVAWKPVLDSCSGSAFPSMAVLSLPLYRPVVEKALKAG